MTQEEKQLLLIDLCARAMYRPFVQLNSGAYNKPEICRLTGVDWPDKVYTNNDSDYYNIANIKPYLRSMSGMTEEEKKEYHKVIVKSQDCSFENNESATMMVSDWLLSKCFDVRGLIPMGLALEANEEMYKTE